MLWNYKYIRKKFTKVYVWFSIHLSCTWMWNFNPSSVPTRAMSDDFWKVNKRSTNKSRDNTDWPLHVLTDAAWDSDCDLYSGNINACMIIMSYFPQFNTPSFFPTVFIYFYFFKGRANVNTGGYAKRSTVRKYNCIVAYRPPLQTCCYHRLYKMTIEPQHLNSTVQNVYLH